MDTRTLSPLRFSLLLRVAAATIVVLGARNARADDDAGVTERAPVTFTRDIAPIVYQRCASCHRPGEVAPFSLLSYRDAGKRASLIRTVTTERSMPPWKAEGPLGHFRNDSRLTEREVALIARWVDQGAPEGNPADLPETPRFAPGWQLGEPDMTVKMAEPYELAADGPDVYRCFVIPLTIPPGKYLKAVEYRAGNRRVVHHAVHTLMPHKQALKRLAEGDGKSFGSGLAPPGQLLPGPLAFWTPGMVPQSLPSGYAAEWPAGADLVLQLHLHPSGKPESEQSSIGLHFSDEKPRARMRLMVLSNNKVDIPADAADHLVTASRTVPSDADLFGVFPHMHLIGRTVHVTARLPDGTTRPIIDIDDWNFNWQLYYQLATPLRLPAGTKLEGRWTYDNSEANAANPSRPPGRVTYGEQTTNEMAILTLDLMPVEKPETTAAAPGGRSPSAGAPATR